MLILLLVLLLIAVCFVLKELVAVRRQLSSIRQSLEWAAVGYLENFKDTMNPAMREYMENAKRDLIREGVRDGTLSSEQQANEIMRRANAKVQVATETTAENPKIHVTSYRVETINTEYMIDKGDNIDNSPSGAEIIWRRLNDCGDEGWEFVTFLPALPAQHFKGDPPNPYVVHAIFKRKAA
jgi:hypothetical protein